MASDQRHFILTIVCADMAGIVGIVGTFLHDQGCFITESQQHSDPETGRFFMRLVFRADGAPVIDAERLRRAFAERAERFRMVFVIAAADHRPRVMIAVSKASRCLADLLHGSRTRALPVNVMGVVSNHPNLEEMVRRYDLPFHHLPVTSATRAEQEEGLLNLFQSTQCDLLILARYMQVLSPDTSRTLAWRCINIHHSFLPSFKGARPYEQAYARGVKLIGATAHFVTDDLDEGPIIEQDVERVDHSQSPQQLATIGADIEARVLTRAVKWYAERRILPNGTRTVVFR
jgi:formyltetrahydrofolate deformylase